MSEQPRITTVIPRQRLRPTFKDLREGEYAWASYHNVEVLADGSVWLEENQQIRHFAGSQPWPDHHKYGDIIIQRLDGKYRIHIFGEDSFVPTESERVEEGNYVAVEVVVDHGPDYETCKTCQGTGFQKKEAEK